jgi:hypothetical protein
MVAQLFKNRLQIKKARRGARIKSTQTLFQRKNETKNLNKKRKREREKSAEKTQFHIISV